MDFYCLLTDLFADEDAFSCVVSLTLILASVFSSLIALSRINEYMKTPDTGSFDTVKKAGAFFKTASGLLYLWCILAALYWLTYAHPNGVGAVYTLITVLAAGAVIFSAFVSSKYSGAKRMYNSLYLKANKGNLNALMGNPLGLDADEKEALDSILITSKKYVQGTASDPLNDILSGAAEIRKSSPPEAVKEQLEGTRAEKEGTRECPFCRRQVENRYPICIYCGMMIPSRKEK